MRSERQNYMKEYNQLSKTKKAKLNYKKTLAAKLTRLRYQEKTRMEILSIYSNGTMKCVNCGCDEIDCLSIDHVNNDGYLQRKNKSCSGFYFYQWIKNNGYPEEFQVLCRNCNWKKRMNNSKYKDFKIW